MPGCPPNSALKILLHVKVTIDVEHLTRDVVAIHNQVADGTSYFLGMPTGFVLIVLDCTYECQHKSRIKQALTGNYP